MAKETDEVRSAEFYRTLVRNAAEGMLTIDKNSDIVYANPAIEDILGYSPEELIGSSKMKIIPERLQSAHANALASYVETGERNIDWNGFELPALHKDGHEVPTLISLREHDHDGKQYFTGIIRDITERRHRENQLRDQKDRLNEFSEILTHDIRNPLSIAQGHAELAQEEHDIPEAEQIIESLERIDSLIEDVNALTQNGDTIVDVEPVAIETCATEAWRNVSTASAELCVEGALGRANADESQLHGFFENLFRNAVEHAGTDVAIQIGLLPDRKGMYVEDTGSGIPESIRGDIFEYGYTTNDNGTGYGLSIVQQIVNEHGWEIAVTESDAGGARFEITGMEFVDATDR
ncbi:two-component system sensor histidine kinase NtrB [Halostagnicola kamekurae]|uniref:histidine kinase n=1 Tax=Halostagnicola kamekurae TaxID=619731 RepID=A0A1I6UA41_9EURY|nr:PAS domain-containing sensor histidine kinase [Halostagnicola kamekurae]SFS98282.1 PAS domain S-box-containing protein [Halostagnicola kamekurae]